MLDIAQLLTMAVGVFIPLLNGLLTKYNSSVARVYLGLVLSTANGLLIEWLAAVNDANQDFNLTQAALGALLSLITAIAVQAGAWAPLGVSETVKRSGVGVSSAPAPNHLRGA
jgi:uncharacterized membrane protein